MDFGDYVGAGGLVTLVLATGPAIKWWVGRRDARKDPIPKNEAIVALAQQGVAIAKEVADELRDELTREREERAALRSEVMQMRHEHTNTQSRLRATEDSLTMLERILAAAARYVEQLLHHIHTGAAPPPPSIPAELRDLVDPDLH